MRRPFWVLGLVACWLAGGSGCNRGADGAEVQGGPPKPTQGAAQSESAATAGLANPPQQPEARNAGAATGDLTGTYTITSASNPGGGAGYKGSVSLIKTGGIYKLAWTIPNSPPYSGVAIPMDATLAVGWGMGARYGVVVYRINGGRLSGQWATAGSGGGIGTEEIEGPAGLNGTYKIVSAKSPDGTSYTGSVAIAPSGETLSVRWSLSAESYSGVGIRQGDLLIVGWGDAGHGAGVVSYQVSGGTLTGKWATPGGTQLGTETINKN